MGSNAIGSFMASEPKAVRILNGYRVIHKPKHPRAMQNECWAGYVYEHIVVAEKYSGMPLRDDEVVHHLDGIRDNNQYSNLLVLTQAQHARLHAWLSAGAPGIERFRKNGENSLKSKTKPPRFCIRCGVTLQDKQQSFCSEICYKAYARRVLRPSKEQLEQDISTMSLVKVGAKYGVSDNAIRKWMKSYGIGKTTMSRAEGTPSEGAETTGEVKSS